MKYKFCSRCHSNLSVDLFVKNSRTKDGLCCWCKSCRKECKRLYYSIPINREKKNKSNREWYNTVVGQEYHKSYSQRDDVKEKRRINRIKHNQTAKRKKWNREYAKKYRKKYRLNHTMSSSIYAALKENKNNLRWQDLVGYTLQELKSHLKKQFTPKMSWNNHGSYWHIDHIIPQSWFSINNSESPDFKMCWSLNNLQPLSRKDNLQKSDKAPLKTLLSYVIHILKST